jgi:hypothetical protein
MSQFSYKYDTETENFTFDFNPVLATGESITAATCTAITLQGTDLTPSAILNGTPVFAAGKATQNVTGGIADNTYRLIMTVNTSAGNVFTCTGDIPVYDPSEQL